MARWVCPSCEREFGSVNQAHTCAPGISVEELLGRHPDWVAEIYDAIMGPLRRLGPIHEDAVNVGIFLKSDRKVAEFRPRARSVLIWILLPERRAGPQITRVLPAGRNFAHGMVLTGPEQVDDGVRDLLELAYDLATD